MKRMLQVAIVLVSVGAFAGSVDLKRVWSWKSGGNCKAYVNGNDAYCKDGDCKAIVNHNDAYCDSKGCKAIVNKNDAYCP